MSAPASTILIADDDAAVRAALSFAFELEGYRIETFADADTLRAANLPPNACVIVDNALAGGHGLSLLRELKARRAALPTILTATNPRRSLRAAAEQAGIPIVEKPLLGNALAQCVHRALHGAFSPSPPPSGLA